MLKAIRAEDPEGFAAFASGALARGKLRGWDWPRFGRVLIVEPPAADRAAWRAVEAFHRHADSVEVTLPTDPSRSEAFAPLDPARRRLDGWGFAVEVVEADPGQPAGLRAVAAGLFPDDPRPAEPVAETAGLTLLGAPQGEGVGLVVARRVRELLAEPGTAPEDVAIVVPRHDEASQVVADTLRSWELPVADDGAAGMLASDPAVTTLLLAMRLPLDGWDARQLARFLRNGQVRPTWPELAEPLALAAVAAAIREARVYRDGDAILEALDRRAAAIDPNAPTVEQRRRARFQAARSIVARLVRVLGALDRSAPWWAQVERLEAARAELGIGAAGGAGRPALDTLIDALDEHGVVLEALDRADAYVSWGEFAREVRSLARELAVPAPPPRPGAVRLTTPEALVGARFRHVLLVNLVEGTFPAREAIDPDPATAEQDEAGPAEPGANQAFAREMLRFLRLVGTAEQSLTLVVPTTDEKGQTLLPAGFLEEVRALFTPEALKGCTTSFRRLDPVLKPELAGSPRERRVRAVALACGRQGDEELLALACDPAHRAPLEGTAAALHVAAHRSGRRKHFGPFEGMLFDRTAVGRIAADFTDNRYTFSASQLESLAFCPFQFFQRYVLRLEPTEDCDELDDDHAARGSLIHAALEAVHTAIKDGAIEVDPDRAESLLAPLLTQIDRELEKHPRPATRVEAGLRQIEAERVRRIAHRYVRQHAEYRATEAGRVAVPKLFEAKFGRAETPDHPPLEIGRAPEVVRFQGMIDRIDVVDLADGVAFRVIDYKTGSAPRFPHLKAGIALQLPLYALAAERIFLADRGGRPLDAGYWALRDQGYKALAEMATLDGGAAVPTALWESLRAAIERYVLDLVGSLRAGAFPVAPRDDDCTRTCDYRVVCRIRQVRQAGKLWPAAPRLEVDS